MKINAEAFGEGFAWGVSSSAYQTEGAWQDDGKGMSIWDVFTAQPGRVKLNQHAHNACSFYNRYIQDIILMQYLGISNFRFSISWPRIFPDGTGKPNDKGLDYYDRLIDFCLEQGIQPWITLYHWDLPFVLEQEGGWTNRDILGWFGKFIDCCLRKFSDRVCHWMVLNEPMVFTGAGYFLGAHAPGRKGLAHFLPAVHHAALSQAMGGKIIQSFNSRLKAGTTFSCSPIDPFDHQESSLEAARRVDALLNRMFIEPLLGMGYPTKDLKILQQLEKYMQPGDEKMLLCDMDFIGLQNYTREVVKYSPLMPYVNARIVKASRRAVESTAMDWEIYPEGIYRILRQFGSYENLKSIIITENGAAFDDELTDGQVFDPNRIKFLQDYLSQVLKAKNEGIPVDGYFPWSFTDNFEWTEGYQKRFGLVYVDYPTQKRIIKSSGFWYKQFLEEKVLSQKVQAV